MGNHRMFAKTICLSDMFIDLPMSTRCLYFSLGLLADDEGFIDNSKSIVRQIAASNDDLSLLISKKYVIMFDSGVICIRHWKVNNKIRADRFQPTMFKEERALVTTDGTGAYILVSELPTVCQPNDNQMTTSCQPNDTDPHPQDKISKDKHKLSIYMEGKPTIEEIEAFIKDKKYSVDAKRFFDYYNDNGWRDTKDNVVKNWKQKIVLWDSRAEATKKKMGANAGYAQTSLSESDFESMFVDLDSDVLEVS